MNKQIKTGVKRMRVLWISRHTITREQRKSLEEYLGEKISVMHITHIWKGTEDSDMDFYSNQDAWNEFSSISNIIVGVFPPVALEAIPWDNEELEILSSVSKQYGEVRKDFSVAQKHIHVRWARIK